MRPAVLAAVCIWTSTTCSTLRPRAPLLQLNVLLVLQHGPGRRQRRLPSIPAEQRLFPRTLPGEEKPTCTAQGSRRVPAGEGTCSREGGIHHGRDHPCAGMAFHPCGIPSRALPLGYPWSPIGIVLASHPGDISVAPGPPYAPVVKGSAGT